MMNIKKFRNEIENIIECKVGSLHGGEMLSELEDWDSLAVLAFIAMIDKNFGIILDAEKITNCKTVDDLGALLGDLISRK